jgi:hypothetical protein
MREDGTEGTAELTLVLALFIRDRPIDVLGYHRPANAHGKRESCDRRYPRDTNGPTRPSTTARNERGRRALHGSAARRDWVGDFDAGTTNTPLTFNAEIETDSITPDTLSQIAFSLTNDGEQTLHISGELRHCLVFFRPMPLTICCRLNRVFFYGGTTMATVFRLRWSPLRHV